MKKNNMMVGNVIKNQKTKSLLFWCCKPLGLKTLQYLLARPDYKRNFILKGLVIFSKDACADEIKDLATKAGIEVFNEVSQVSGGYDLGFCVGFPQKISKEILETCQDGVINLHFAPLPAYRGSGTLTHAIVNKEKEYGVTLHVMDEKLDTGPIITVKTAPLSEDETAIEVIKTVEKLAYQVILENFTHLIEGSYELINQDDIIKEAGIKPQFCTRKSVEDLHHLDFSWDFDTVHRYVRALTLGKAKKPYFEKNGKKIYLSLYEA